MEEMDIIIDSAVADAPQTAGNHVVLGTDHFREANQRVREALACYDTVVLDEVFAQRYLGCAMPAGKRLEINGTPGNDMACYMDGGDIEVFGNAQDQIGNTMNGGRVVVHGRCGDAAGYAMRGGTLLIRDDCGWRVGIHMKQYEDRRPAVVIGGDAGNFLGEYMAGGVIVLMGTPGEYLATGMHGGAIYLKKRLDSWDVPAGLVLEPVDEGDVAVLAPLLADYEVSFAGEPAADAGRAEEYWKLEPASSRPYAAMYAN